MKNTKFVDISENLWKVYSEKYLKIMGIFKNKPLLRFEYGNLQKIRLNEQILYWGTFSKSQYTERDKLDYIDRDLFFSLPQNHWHISIFFFRCSCAGKHHRRNTCISENCTRCKSQCIRSKYQSHKRIKGFYHTNLYQLVLVSTIQ